MTVVNPRHADLLDAIRRHVVAHTPEQAWVVDRLAFLHVGGSTLATALRRVRLERRGSRDASRLPASCHASINVVARLATAMVSTSPTSPASIM